MTDSCEHEITVTEPGLAPFVAICGYVDKAGRVRLCADCRTKAATERRDA